MLSELFWISLGLTSEIEGYKKNPHINFERGNEYISRLGYNRERQLFLNDLIYSSNENKQNQFYNILGHKIDWSKYAKYNEDDRIWIAKDEAIQEISIKEGWKYFDGDELYSDPVYRKIIGMETRPPIISYKSYPEKVLMSPEELERYNKDIANKNRDFTENTVFSTIVPVVLSIIAILIANSSTSDLGGILYFVFAITSIATAYFSFFRFKDKSANGYIQFFVYILCPFIVLANATNCKSMPVPLMFLIIVTLILHISCVVGYAIYYHRKLN